MRWHCPPDREFEIRVLTVWGRARYLSVTDAPHNIESLRINREETFCFFKTWMSEWGSNPRCPTFQTGNFNQGPHPVHDPRVVVSTAAFHARVRGSVPGLGGLKEKIYVSSPSTCESQYCGEPPWPRGSVLGLRPPELEFRILCLEDSVISIISPSSGGSPGPV